MNFIFTSFYDNDKRVLINWDNVCYAESRGADGEEPHARIYFNVAGRTDPMAVEIVEDIDDITLMLEEEGEAVIEVEDVSEDEC
jgi:hypothetical protein